MKNKRALLNPFYPTSKPTNKMFAYNHKKSEWKAVASMQTPRAMFGAVIHNGRIIVTGGVNEDGIIATCEAYDFGTNKYVLGLHDSRLNVNLKILRIEINDCLTILHTMCCQ